MKLLPALRSGVLFLFLCAAIPLHAEVIYVRDMSNAPGFSVLPLAKAPIDTSDPLYDPSWSPSLPGGSGLFSTDAGYFQFDPASGVFGPFIPMPAASIKLVPLSLVALTGVDTSAPQFKILGFRNRLYTYDVASNTLLGDAAKDYETQVPLFIVSSLAVANRQVLTAIADGGFHTIDDINLTPEGWATVTTILTFDGGMAPGEFSLDTRYHAHAPNGFVYLFDYGNDRMQWLDPANDFAYVGEFALQTGVTTANMQFAIGSTGNIYLGDGLGGGSTYDADGTFLGSFALPDTVTGDEFLGVPYVSTDQGGHVYIFDDTGFHQYLDASVVPEPATSALFIGAGILALAIARRRKQTT